ncbi:hypothetical protein ALC60_00531 [Trachymyrmex zeteki]|uniref:Uncharacterized protein n=1 Tax=Mycetomoellerius zeteki TaxID=64791 RepID=A0A151XII6_9HYME|nr:hypothetical protein ALC60_00531 [Trachymyrmex zeteki]
MELQLAKYTQREDLDEYFRIILTIMTDLMIDVEKTENYLAFAKNGLICTNLLSLEHIIVDLREAASQLTKGLHFPFQVKLENWHNVQKYISINAFFVDHYIFTTLKFPVIAYSTYKVTKAISLPVYESSNIIYLLK